MIDKEVAKLKLGTFVTAEDIIMSSTAANNKTG